MNNTNGEIVEIYGEQACQLKKEMSAVGLGVIKLALEYSENKDIDKVLYTISVIDWQAFLSAVGYDDEVLSKVFQRWAWVEIVATSTECRVSSYFDIPLPSCVGRKKFIKRFGAGDKFRDAAMAAVLSRYNGDEILMDCLRFVGRIMDDFHRRVKRGAFASEGVA